MIIKQIVISTILFTLIILLIRKKIDMLEAFVILLPFKSISFELGLTVYVFYLPLLSLIIIKLLMHKSTKLKVPYGLIFLLTYISLSTIIISNLFIDKFIQNEYYSNYFRSEGRYLSILFKTIILDFGLMFLIFNLVENIEQINSLLKKYLQSLIILCYLGILQIATSVFLKIDMFPNNISNIDFRASEISLYIENFLPFVRMSSLGGEPKNLAISLSVGVILLSFMLYKNVRIIKHQFLIIILFVLCIFLTLSTSGILLIGILGMIFIFLFLSNGIILKKSTWKFSLFKFTMSVLLILFIFISKDFFSQVIKTRIIERSSEIASEEVDKSILEYLIENPKWTIFGSGSGNIHNLVGPTIKNEAFGLHVFGNIFSSRYGYLKLISENGFIGFIIFTYLFMRIAYNKRNPQNDYGTFLKLSTFTALIFYFARADYVFLELLFISSLTLAHKVLLKYS